MVEVLYGLTRADEAKYISMLSKVQRLPVVVNLEKFGHAAVVDGMKDDVYHEHPSLREVALPAPSSASASLLERVGARFRDWVSPTTTRADGYAAVASVDEEDEKYSSVGLNYVDPFAC